MASQVTTLPWHEVDKALVGLPTDVDHVVEVQREAIPLVFIPGIMGSCLRRAGTDGTGTGSDGLPTMRWNPSSSMWMLKHVSGTSGQQRKALLVGRTFEPGYLEVADAHPVADGFAGIMEDYTKFLNLLKTQQWGALSKIFEFPVYAVGYNWTDDNANAGAKLAARITEIIGEAGKIVGLCERVILITHSMGGLVSRWASEVAGAGSSILGIIHGVQPASGAPAAYWRIKAGFEGFGMSSRVLGNSGERVTPVLGNIPGGLELLPNKLYKTNAGETAWLTVTQDKKRTLALPSGNPPDPYREIYRVRADVNPQPGQKPSTNTYWGLVDANLLDPQSAPTDVPNRLDDLDASVSTNTAWPNYLRLVGVAESFHDRLGRKVHRRTFCVGGIGHTTTDAVEMQVSAKWGRYDPYPTRGFRGFFTDSSGKAMLAALQDGAGDGDATVPRSSSALLDAAGKPPPGDTTVAVEHQPAYENGDVQAFVLQAIRALCSVRFHEKRGGLAGDFPTAAPNVHPA